MKRSETIAVRVTPAMRATLEKLAEDDRRTVSSLVEILLEAALEQYEKRKRR